MTISEWLHDSSAQLAEIGITTASLDCELILAHTLRKGRTWLHAHADEGLEPRVQAIANARIDLRLDRTPIAYIVGHKEFYGRRFHVTPATLIPRPESEVLIELLNTFITHDMRSLLDVGTGTGCLGITAKLEHPGLNVTLADTSNHALRVAEENANNLQASIHIIHSDLLARVPGKFSVIMANLPYVDESWERSPETRHEPDIALFADKHGLALIMRLIEEAIPQIEASGLLILEADPVQHNKIIKHAVDGGLTHLKTEGYGMVFGMPSDIA